MLLVSEAMFREIFVSQIFVPAPLSRSLHVLKRARFIATFSVMQCADCGVSSEVTDHHVFFM